MTDNMSLLSIRFAKAIAAGRMNAQQSDSRERVLVTLLRKRAAAKAAGADDLEAMLRAQILWSLPTYSKDADGQLLRKVA